MLNNITKKVTRRIMWAINGRSTSPSLLEMVWPNNSLSHLPHIKLPDEYKMRQFETKDITNYYRMLAAADMQQPSFTYWDKYILPNGFFVIDEIKNNKLVAACFASHHSVPRHSQAGNLGWLAVDPAHRGHQLGYALALAVTARLIAGGYSRMYLETHDHRLSAIAIYLKLGWLPFLYLPEMEERWFAICKTLQWPFTPERWLR